MKKLMLSLTIALCMFCFVAITPQPAQAEGTYVTTIDNVDYTLVFEAGPFSPYESGYAYLYDTFGKLVGKWNYRGTYLADDVIKYDVLGVGLFLSDHGFMKVYLPTDITLSQTGGD